MSTHVPIQIATLLLLDEAGAVPSAGRWLLAGGEAALAEGLARSGVALDWLPFDVRERDLAPDHVVVRDNIGGAYECVVLPVTPDRRLARRWLVIARQVLVPGGVLLVAGANAEGAKSVMADARSVFGAPVVEDYRQKHRIGRFVRRDDPGDLPSWAQEEGIGPGSWRQVDMEIAGQMVTLETQPGVFAADRLDAGTRLLLDHLEVSPGSRVLDVGCGAGAIGIAASLHGASAVDLVDANLLAIAAAARNLERLGISGRAIASDVFDAVSDKKYDLIVSNPPFHQGKQVDYSVADRLINEAPRHLLPGGRLLVVANAFLAYGKQLGRVFRQVETVAATRQYHVLLATDPR